MDVRWLCVKASYWVQPNITSRDHRGQILIFEFRLTSGLIDQIKLLGEGNSGIIQRLGRIEDENKHEHLETRALIKISFSQLDKRISDLESQPHPPITYPQPILLFFIVWMRWLGSHLLPKSHGRDYLHAFYFAQIEKLLIPGDQEISLSAQRRREIASPLFKEEPVFLCVLTCQY